MGKMKIGEFLLKEKIITQEQIEKALEYQKEHPGAVFGKALIDLGFATDKTISNALKKIIRGG